MPKLKIAGALLAVMLLAACHHNPPVPPPPPTPALQIITQGNLPGAEVGLPYKAVFAVLGGVPPYIWAAPNGTAPGLSLTISGELLGTPTVPGAFTFVVQVTDSAKNMVQAQVSMNTISGEVVPTNDWDGAHLVLASTGSRAPAVARNCIGKDGKPVTDARGAPITGCAPLPPAPLVRKYMRALRAKPTLTLPAHRPTSSGHLCTNTAGQPLRDGQGAPITGCGGGEIQGGLVITIQGAAPVVSSVTPNFGPTGGGTGISINGNNFRPGAIPAVALNACASPTVVSSSSITCNTPPGAVGSADVTVTNVDNSSGTLPGGFTYQGSGGGGGTLVGPASFSVMIDGGAPGVAWSYGAGPTSVPACDTTGGITNNTGTTSDPNSEACFLNQFELQMCYLNQNHFGSVAYLKWNASTQSWVSPTNPIVYYFPKENGTSTYWDDLRNQLHTWDAALSTNCPSGLGAGLANGTPLLVTEDNFSKPHVDGAFNWLAPLAWNASTNCTAQGGTGSQYCWNGSANNYIDNFYASAQAAPTMFATGAAKKGFDDNNASWGSNRVIAQQCGKVWMNTWAKVAAAGYTSGTQLAAIGIPTWNDYEEGSEIETGIDPCYRISLPTVSGSTLSWTFTTNDNTYAPLSSGTPANNTVSYTQVLACDTNNNNCVVAVDNIPLSTHTASVAAIASGNWHIFVRLVGAPSIWSVTSAAVNYTGAGTAPFSGAVTQVGNNTSACGNPAPTYCVASFTGLSDTSGDPGLQTPLPDPAPANVSLLDPHVLLYSGATTQIVAHMQGWFCASGDTNCSGSHVQVGYSSNDPDAVHAQMNDVIQRHIDAVSMDWYGPGNTTVDGALSAIDSDLTARYTTPGPTISGVSPASGGTVGGTAVTVSGTNFRTGAALTFAGVSATSVVVANSTTITAITPAGSAGAADVTVTNTDGSTATLAAGFSYTTSGGTTGGCSTGFSDSFATGTLNPALWTIDTGTAPGNIGGVNAGTFSASNVDLTTGMLRLKVAQTGAAPVTSVGAQVRSVNRCGYGTYQWTFRAASTATTPNGTGSLTSGQVSSSFLYYQNPSPITEIDAPEIEGQAVFGNPAGKTLEYTNWTNGTSNTNTNVLAPAQPDQGFHTYKVIWTPGNIQYYFDGALKATHTVNIPTQPAYILMNLWGTNSAGFGGLATTSATRYMYVSQFTFVPYANAALVASVPTGGGSVSTSPAGISCPGTCTANFTSGTSITATATAATGWVFAGWSGLCTGTTNPCVFIMPSTGSLAASFTPISAGGGRYSITNLPAFGTQWFTGALMEHRLPRAGNGGPTKLMPNSDAVIAHIFSENSDGTTSVLPTSTSGGMITGHFAAPGPSDYNNTALYFGNATDPQYNVTGIKTCGDYFEPLAVRNSSGYITNLTIHAPSGAQFSGQGGGSDQGIELLDQSGGRLNGWQFGLYGYNEGNLQLPACSPGQTCTFNRSNGYCSAAPVFTTNTMVGHCGASASNHMCGAAGAVYFSEPMSGHINHAAHWGTGCEATAGGAEPNAVFPNQVDFGALQCSNRSELAPPSASLYFLDYTDTQLNCMNPDSSTVCTGNNGSAIAKLANRLQYSWIENLSHYGGYEADTQGPNTSDAGRGIFTEHLQASQSYLYYQNHGVSGAFSTTFQSFATWYNSQCSGSFTSPTNPCYTVGGAITNTNTRWLFRIFYGVPKNISGPTCTASNACGILKHLHIADPCNAVAMAGLPSATVAGKTWVACPQ